MRQSPTKAMIADIPDEKGGDMGMGM